MRVAGDLSFSKEAGVRIVAESMERLRSAGYEVSPADGVPGLWDVAGLARDVTTNQLHDLAARHWSPLTRQPLRFIVAEPL